MKDEQSASMRKLRTIPGVGLSIAKDLYDLGYRDVSDLKGENPESMYQKSCEQAGVTIDRCLLYVYRCAVYFASNDEHASDKLNWWYWKDMPGKEHTFNI